MDTSRARGRVLDVVRALLPSSAGPGCVLTAMDRVEQSARADRLVDAARAVVRAVPMGRSRDALHGRWLGHPVHPLMVQLPVGSWMSAAVLDFVPGRQRAARTLVGVGLVAALPAAAAGWTDWAELRRPQMRVGLVHAASNAVGVAFYGVSFAARARGRFARGRLWGLAGLAAVSVGGAVGGHMAFRQASGANHAEHVAELVGDGWHPLGDLADFAVGAPARGRLGEVSVVVVRESSGTVRVLADRCSHMGGLLSEGEVAEGCIRCPWHGSTFRLSDGWNTAGPATAAQPAFTTRITGTLIEARLQHLSDKVPPTAAASGEGNGW
ncbi:Rieske (2Fe-2S) protein [Streptomyces arboris]|uniref:Rieske (2Fe-2S) protein n=2 Tax=Streptomyces arboris TaxID=2600619 RepID=A0A5N5EJB9_9ACTN|nr:Rieske (2Fe-2S) protein [Streptomyces arboris]